MASVHGYTTATKVKFKIENYEAGAQDAEIDILINQAEGFIIAWTKTVWKTTIPLLIESAVTNLAALYLLQHDPSGLSSTSEAALEADILWAVFEKELALLGDERVILFLKGTRQ